MTSGNSEDSIFPKMWKTLDAVLEKKANMNLNFSLEVQNKTNQNSAALPNSASGQYREPKT